MNQIDWSEVSLLCQDVHFLTKYVEYLDWVALSLNPAAISLLEMYPYKIDWEHLSLNPAAYHILWRYRNRIYWPHICFNAEVRKQLPITAAFYHVENCVSDPAPSVDCATRASLQARAIAHYHRRS
jgi:hypothetical protein